MGWIDDMKLLTALEVGGNVTQTLVQAPNAGSNDSEEATIRKLDDQSNRREGECPCSSIGKQTGSAT